MDKITERNMALDAVIVPAFLVEAGTVTQVNAAAERLLILKVMSCQ